MGTSRVKLLLLLGAAALALGVLVPAAGGAAGPRAAGVSMSGICGTARTRPPQRFAHVILIVLENHSRGDILGPPGSPAAGAAPFTNALAAACGQETNYHSVTHPSLPNYLALTAGSTFGITTDCHCRFPIGGIFAQAALSHLTWGAYLDGMPSVCDRVRGGSGLYTQRHNPPVLFARLSTCATRDLPLGTTSSGPLAHALSSRQLPNYVFIAPDLCHDMHSCPISTGDAWLAAWIPRITHSFAYQRRATAIFITFDEGSHGTIGNGEVCADHPTDGSCHVALLVVSRFVRPGTVVTEPATHFSLLRLSEHLLGLPALRNAATAHPLGGFGL